jgi:hypothetical protein
MFKGYDASDAGLQLYSDDFKIWCAELKKNSVINLNYLYYYSHTMAIENLFKLYSKGDYEDIEPVLEIENKYFELCHQGGLTYCQEYQGPCYGYDFNSAYPRIRFTQTINNKC